MIACLGIAFPLAAVGEGNILGCFDGIVYEIVFPSEASKATVYRLGRIHI
jgi:hypothetical protein